MKIVFIILLMLIASSFLTTDVLSTKSYSLKRDGCCLLKNVLSKEDIDVLLQDCKLSHYKHAKDYVLNHKTILKRIQQYVFK